MGCTHKALILLWFHIIWVYEFSYHFVRSLVYFCFTSHHSYIARHWRNVLQFWCWTIFCSTSISFWGPGSADHAVVFNTRTTLHLFHPLLLWTIQDVEFWKITELQVSECVGHKRGACVSWSVDCLQFSLRICRSTWGSGAGSAQKVGQLVFRLRVSTAYVIILLYKFEYVVIWKFTLNFVGSVLVLYTVSAQSMCVECVWKKRYWIFSFNVVALQ